MCLVRYDENSSDNGTMIVQHKSKLPLLYSFWISDISSVAAFSHAYKSTRIMFSTKCYSSKRYYNDKIYSWLVRYDKKSSDNRIITIQQELILSLLWSLWIYAILSGTSLSRDKTTILMFCAKCYSSRR